MRPLDDAGRGKTTDGDEEAVRSKWTERAGRTTSLTGSIGVAVVLYLGYRLVQYWRRPAAPPAAQAPEEG